MVLFREVLIEKDGKFISLKDLNYQGLFRLMINGNFNVVHLTKERTIFFHKDDASKYGIYDLRSLENREEVFEEIIVQHMDEEMIERSVTRKEYLLHNLFNETNVFKAPSSVTSSTTTEAAAGSSSSPPSKTTDSPENSKQTKHEILNKCLVECCDADAFEFDPQEVRNTDLIEEELEDEDQFEKEEYVVDQKEEIKIRFDEEEEKKLTYFERQMLESQRLLFSEVNSIKTELKKLNFRIDEAEKNLSFMNQKVSYLYERQSMPFLLKKLNEEYLIEIRNLDTRLLSCSESPEMMIFFRFVARQFKNSYEERWRSIKNILNMSLSPRAIEFDLLGFGSWNKKQVNKRTKAIESPSKLTDNKVSKRSSFMSFEKDFGREIKNVLVVFEVTTAKIYSNFGDTQNLTKDERNKYDESMKKLIKKLSQLERQIFYLQWYYSLSIHQFFTGLIIFDLYRNLNTSPDEVLNNIMNFETIKNSFPLICQLHQWGQFTLSY